MRHNITSCTEGTAPSEPLRGTQAIFAILEFALWPKRDRRRTPLLLGPLAPDIRRQNDQTRPLLVRCLPSRACLSLPVVGRCSSPGASVLVLKRHQALAQILAPLSLPTQPPASTQTWTTSTMGDAGREGGEGRFWPYSKKPP